MNVWISTILSVVIVSLISMIGIFFIALKDKSLRKIIIFLVSFSAGSLFGGAFIHLIPEAIDEIGLGLRVPVGVIFGIMLFFVLEKFIHWRHCHIPTSHNHPHPLGMMNIIGDGFHNLLDGMVIAAAYLTDTGLGIATTIAVVVHEIPQEISDFGVLLHAGYSKAKAIALNFMSALAAVIGAIIVLAIGLRIESIIPYLLPITAGGFIYIAGSDLIPELKKETVPLHKTLVQFLGLILGISLMILLAIYNG